MKRWVLQGSLILALIGLTWGVNSVAARQNRGQGVKLKVGNGEEVQLYEGSYALVIGVSDYTQGWPKLPGVKTDVAEVKKVLETQGFLVQTAADPTHAQFKERMERFIGEYGYTGGNRLLVYFAGHGHTGKSADGREMGYIVPADAPLPDKDDRRFRQLAISMDQVEGYARQIEAKHALFVFDSCFSGSLFTTTRSIPPVISKLTAQPVRQFITAGTEQQIVPDKSLFREQFVEGLQGAADRNQDGYITASELAMYLQEKVSNYSRDAQTPQYGKIRDAKLDRGDLVFEVVKSSQPGGAGNSSAGGTSDRSVIELEYWRTIQNSTDPEDFKAYLKKYPNGEFGELARNRISRMENGGRPNPGSGSSASRPPVAPAPARQMTNRLGMEFVLIPEGSFEMGSNSGEADEKPVHQVRISQPFYMGKYEVTIGEYLKYCRETNRNWPEWLEVGSTYHIRSGGNAFYKPFVSDSEQDRRPIVGVSWNDAVAYCEWLSRKTGETYRLPSEAEWEYACRAGTTGEYAGNLDEVGWYSGNSDGKTHPVGQKSPNGWGLYDMHGNVWEWCQDWYEEGYYGKSPGSDPTGPSRGTHRVIRGGSWNSPAPNCRSANRYRNTPDNRYYGLGFRLVRTAP